MPNPDYRNRSTIVLLVGLLVVLVLWVNPTTSESATKQQAVPAISKEGKECLDCHAETTPGIVDQRKNSAHYAKGVDCFGCHKANQGDPATFDH